MKNIAISLILLCLFLFGKNDATGQKKDKSNIEKPNINFILTDHWRTPFLGKLHFDGHGRKLN